jgi:hypothetical protein
MFYFISKLLFKVTLPTPAPRNQIPRALIFTYICEFEANSKIIYGVNQGFIWGRLMRNHDIKSPHGDCPFEAHHLGASSINIVLHYSMWS